MPHPHPQPEYKVVNEILDMHGVITVLNFTLEIKNFCKLGKVLFELFSHLKVSASDESWIHVWLSKRKMSLHLTFATARMPFGNSHYVTTEFTTVGINRTKKASHSMHLCMKSCYLRLSDHICFSVGFVPELKAGTHVPCGLGMPPKSVSLWQMKVAHAIMFRSTYMWLAIIGRQVWRHKLARWSWWKV